jgi:hypothetical protein
LPWLSEHVRIAENPRGTVLVLEERRVLASAPAPMDTPLRWKAAEQANKGGGVGAW